MWARYDEYIVTHVQDEEVEEEVDESYRLELAENVRQFFDNIKLKEENN